MFKEIEQLRDSFIAKTKNITKDEHEEWLLHPVTVAMFSDLKQAYISAMQNAESAEERRVIEQILNSWERSSEV